MKKNPVLLAIAVVVLISGFYLLFQNTATAPTQPNPTSTTPSAETASSSCSGELTPSQTEGPYYTENSPERSDITDGKEGQKLVVSGYVYDADCQPIANAWLDFWQADSNGEYDNEGYQLRGHQYTDANGRYELTTIVPAAYEVRPPHIHLKVRGNGEILTSQLYFPNEAQNRQDQNFNEQLTVDNYQTSGETWTAEYNFVVSK